MSFLQRINLLLDLMLPWVRSHRKVLIGGIGALLVIVLAIQLFYPAEQALPGARLNGKSVAGKAKDELVHQVHTDFDDASLVLEAGEVSETMPLSQAGATVEAERTVERLSRYPLWQRLLPLSILLKRPQVEHLQVTFDTGRLNEIATTTAEKLSIPAQDAKLIIAEDALKVTPAKSGQQVTADAIKRILSESDIAFGATTLEAPRDEQLPAVSDDDIALIRTRAEAILERQFVVVAPDGRVFTPMPADVTAWLTVTTPAEGKPELTVNREQMASYIDQLNEKIGTKPGTIKATLIDGEEVSRTQAPSGLAIARDEIIDSLAKAVLEDESPTSKVTTRLVVVPPTVSYDRSYTSSQQGLRAYVDHVTKSEDVRIAVSQTKTNGWSAHGRADEQVVSASTYKLYVAYMLFDQIKQGKLSWGSEVVPGIDVSGCLERMIVLSDNPCAEKFIEMFGAKAINSFLYGKGISQTTTFISSVAAQTSAADLEKILHGIENGSSIGGDNRTKLLDAMARQRYRSGVPAGSAGSVQDKVGFLWDYLHDAAIVRHPKGTYTVVILTKGASWQRIAEITKQIEQIMYP